MYDTIKIHGQNLGDWVKEIILIENSNVKNLMGKETAARSTV